LEASQIVPNALPNRMSHQTLDDAQSQTPVCSVLYLPGPSERHKDGIEKSDAFIYDSASNQDERKLFILNI
jgi:hypothetical protein